MYAILCNKYNFFPKTISRFVSRMCVCVVTTNNRNNIIPNVILFEATNFHPLITSATTNSHPENRLIFIFRLQIVFTKSIKILQHSTSPLLREIRSLALNGFYGFFSFHSYLVEHEFISVPIPGAFTITQPPINPYRYHLPIHFLRTLSNWRHTNPLISQTILLENSTVVVSLMMLLLDAERKRKRRYIYLSLRHHQDSHFS